MSRTIPVTISLAIAILVIVDASALAKSAAGRHAQEQVVPIEVTSAGFVPAQIKTKAMQPIKLVVTRTTDRTCVKKIVIKDFGIDKPLPLNQSVEIRLTPSKPGQVRYACGMNMVAGVITVE
jgi:plastocyanin domain-containing protein